MPVPINAPRAFLQRSRILVVEDEPIVSMMIEDALVQVGGSVIAAGSAEDALELLDREDVHCAVLDIKLMNGSSRLVAEALARRGVRFIVVTGVDQDQVPSEYNGAPIVQKVFAAHELVDAVADVLTTPRGTHMADAPRTGIETPLHKMLASGALLQSLPIGVYCCEPDGTICNFNLRAAALWGRMPRIGETDERFCGAHKLFLPDGTALPHDKTPMAEALRIGKATIDQKVLIERPDGSRVLVLVNIEPLYDKDGVLVGAVNCFREIDDLTGLDGTKSPIP